MEALRRHGVLLAAAAMVCVALGGQAATTAMMPTLTARDTAIALGDAGFAYLTGIRRYVAAVLWNRLDPIMHSYYAGEGLGEQRYAVPSLVLVTMLDPGFERAYYVGSWVLVRNGLVDEAVEYSRLGLENNPRSGLLRVSLAEELWVFGTDADKVEAVEVARGALTPETEWADLVQKHDNYAVMNMIFTGAGDLETVALITSEIERLDAEIGDALPAGSHDHDGDGVPDH